MDDEPTRYLTSVVKKLLALSCVIVTYNALTTAESTSTRLRDNSHDREIPKILHHIFLGTADFGPPLSPEKWAKWQANAQTCVDMSPDFEHILWNNSMVLDMLHKHFPAHVENYNSYSYGVQRADAARYFILHKYGGIYIDMDIECKAPLSDVIAYVTSRRAVVGLPENSWHGVTNDLLVSAANHRFFARTIEALAQYNANYGLPYATVMYSTGPKFLTARLTEYLQELKQDAAAVDVVVLPLGLSHGSAGMFGHTGGSTWHAADGRILYHILRNPHYALLFVLICFAVIGYTQCSRYFKRRRSIVSKFG